MKILDLPIKTIKPYKRNPRKNDQAVEYVANSIRQFGFKVPIVIDENYEIVCGHTRWKAAKVIGLETVPCIMADDLNEDQIRAFRLADNKTAEMADWDFDLLEMEFNEIDPDLFDMADFGFFADDEKESAPAAIVEDDVPEPDEVEPCCKRGQIWTLGCHRLMCGDSTSAEDVDHLLDGKFMRMTVTSPPYGVGKDYEEKGIEPWRKTINGVIDAIKGKTLIICWNIGDLFSTGTQFTEPTGAYSIQMMDEAGYGMLYNRIWRKPGANFAGNNPYYTVTTKPAQDYEYLYAFAEKDADRHIEHIKKYLFTESEKASINDSIIKSEGGPGFMCGHWFTDHQWALIDEKNYSLIQKWCTKNNIDAFKRDYSEIKADYLRNTIFSHILSDDDFSSWGLYGVWEFNTVHERLGGHAAAYPVELPTRYIKIHSYKGDYVLDPFGGTGTTLIACEQLDRRCYMMELDPHYCDVIIKRWENLTGKKAVLCEE